MREQGEHDETARAANQAKGAPTPQELLEQRFGFDEFLPGQRRVVDDLLAGHSAAAVFPTGGGKSLCYQLPALLLPGLTVVVSPLIALMKDQIDALSARSIAARRLDSSLTLEQHREIMDAIRAGSLRMLYVAPERFNNERFRASMERVRVSLFAVDEAHCISEWGHNFRPDYLKLARFAETFGAERILALTATATPRVLDDMCRAFRIAPEHAVRTPLYRSNLNLRASPVTAEARDEALVSSLRSHPPGSTIVYVTLQKTASDLAERLRQQGFEARHYHAGLESEERNAVQDWFMRHDRAIVVATIAFGMGVDKANIRAVYHYNLPKSLESYTQEIGRAGRDGASARCQMFVCPDDLEPLENFAYGDTPSPEAVDGLVRELFMTSSDQLTLNLDEISTRHDIRPLVLRTLLTDLELDGYLEAGTPFFSTYRFKPMTSSAEILARFEGNRREFLAGIFRRARKSRVWFDIDPAEVARALRVPRQRVLRALDWLGEQELLEVRSAGVRHRYRRLAAPRDLDALVRALGERMVRREEAEIARLAQVLDWAASDRCQTAALLDHFGEDLGRRCGHCTSCLDGPAVLLERRTPSIDAHLWKQALAVRAEHTDVLSEPRSFARFLCGIRSPRLSRARLARHPLFGALAQVPFAEVAARVS